MKKYQKLKFIKLFEAFEVEQSLIDLVDEIEIAIENIVDEQDGEKDPAYPVMEMILNKIKGYFHGKYEFGEIKDTNDGYQIKTEKMTIYCEIENENIIIGTNGNRKMEIVKIVRDDDKTDLTLIESNDGNHKALADFLTGTTEDIKELKK